MTHDEILNAYPDLEAEDIREALHFAAGTDDRRTRLPVWQNAINYISGVCGLFMVC